MGFFMEAILTEPENINYVISLLSKDFVCVVEDIENDLRIKGIHPTGKTLFIDALIRPKNPDGWRNGKNTVFGIEFKKDSTKGANVLKHIAQAIDYSQSEWYYKDKNIGKIPILLYPSPTDSDTPYKNIGAFVVRLLGMFNIGTIGIGTSYYTKGKIILIRMSDSLLYSTTLGASGNAKSNKLELKVGSR